MNKFPLVTIGIPNYNYGHYIAETLNSVIGQSYHNIELIIVDDCSTDNSVEVIENWITRYQGNIRIKFIKNKLNIGLTKVCNLVLLHASGIYFQVLDADDILLPEKIKLQVELLQSATNAAFIYSNISVIDEKGKIISSDYLGTIGYDKNCMPQGNLFEDLIAFNFIPLPSVLVKTECARKIGGFDESLQVQDYYMWLRLSESYEALYLNEITGKYRVHETSMSNSALTNPKSNDSVLAIKYKYYHTCNNTGKAIIRKNIYNSVPYLYKNASPSARYWLKQNLLLNPGLKSFAYFIAITLGIPFSFFQRLGSTLHHTSSNIA